MRTARGYSSGSTRDLPARFGPNARYNLVTLTPMKTGISLPDETFERVERAAAKLGVSRSEFFARAAERWLDALDDDQMTEAINRALAGVPDDKWFTDVAAAGLAAGHNSA